MSSSAAVRVSMVPAGGSGASLAGCWTGSSLTGSGCWVFRRFSGYCDGGSGPWAAPGFAFVFASVVASTHADLVLGVVAEVRDGRGRGGFRRIDVSVIDLP